MEMMDLGGSCVAIAILCLVVGMVFKNIAAVPGKWIPCIVACAGAILGVSAFCTLPDFASDWLTALQIGVVSGLASTGLHQAIKQQLQVDVTTLAAMQFDTKEDKEDK